MHAVVSVSLVQVLWSAKLLTKFSRLKSCLEVSGNSQDFMDFSNLMGMAVVAAR